MRIRFSIFLLSLAMASYSQTELNLNECLEYAFTHNIELLEYSNNIDKSEISLSQTYLNFLPSLNAEYNHYLNSGRSLNVETYSWENQDIQQGNLALSTELVIFKSFFNLYARQAAQIDLDKSKLALQQKKLQLGLTITLLFHKVALTQSNIVILELIHTNTNEDLQKIEEQIRAGTVAKSNIYELQAQAKKEELEILSLQNEKEKHINNLSKLLNWKDINSLRIDTRPVLLNKDNELAYQDSFPRNLLIEKSVITRVAEREVDLANKAILIKRSNAFPGLFANGSISSRYLKDAIDPLDTKQYTYLHQLDNNQYLQLALTFRIPIFNRYHYSSEVKLLKIDRDNKKLQLEGLKQELIVELGNIQTDITFLKRKIQETEKLVDAYKKSYEAATEKYYSGLLDSYTLNTSKNNLTGSILQLNKLQVELSMNIKLLELYKSFTIQ